MHGIAEGVMAGPQFRRSGTIRLAATADGIATVADPRLLLTPTGLQGPAGATVPLSGTFDDLAAAVGERFTIPDMYGDHAPVQGSDEVVVDEAAAARLVSWFADGAQALQDFNPDLRPVLWPEHFDVGITWDEVNYGVSPGDGFSLEPYAYVGPWEFDPQRQSDGFFAAAFGAVMRMSEVGSTSALRAFFAEGRQRLG
jgi:hypothetical protein